MSEYPKWKYHGTEPAVIVQDADEEKALGKGWKDTQVDDNTAKDPSTGTPVALTSVTGDDVFDAFLADNGLADESSETKAKIRIGYDHVVTSTGTIPQVEFGHPVGPQDSTTMVDDETARQLLLTQARDMGVEVHPLNSSKTIQTKIDEFNATKSSTPAAAPEDDAPLV